MEADFCRVIVETLEVPAFHDKRENSRSSPTPAFEAYLTAVRVPYFRAYSSLVSYLFSLLFLSLFTLRLEYRLAGQAIPRVEHRWGE
jgi:hypothetical protein